MKKLALTLLSIIFIYSCSTTKYVPEEQLLLVENEINIDNTDKKDKKINEYLIQRPNFKALGVPLSLYFYNFGNPKGPEEVSEWKKKHPFWYNTSKSIFSEKQSISVANSFIGINKWFLRNGEAPVIIDSSKIKKTEKNLNTYLQNNGFFKAKISSKIDTLSKKKGKVTYFIKKDKPLIIDSIKIDIESPVLKSIYEEKKQNSFLRPNQQYNNQNFINEAEQITKLFRNNGVYKFGINSIGFWNIDTSSYKTNVLLKIKNQTLETKGTFTTKPYKIQRIKNINIYTDYAFDKRNLTPKHIEQNKGINFIAYDKLKFNPKYLSQSIFIKPNQIYSDTLRSLTRKHLRSLKNFKTTTLSYNELDDENLEANIFLSPIEKYTLGIETELSRSNIRNYDIATQFSLTNRNTFRGAEILKITTHGSYFNSKNGPGWELGVDTSIEIPRMLAPFGIQKLIPKKMYPKTRFYAGTNIQKNIGLDKQNYHFGLDYKWSFNKRKHVHLEILNTQYIRNFNVEDYFKIYQSEYSKIKNAAEKLNYTKSLDTNDDIIDFFVEQFSDPNIYQTNPAEVNSLINIVNRFDIITSDFLIPTIAYSFTYNNQENFKDNNFSYFKIRFANSGNFLGYINKEENSREKSTLFKIPVAQYFKTDIEYKKFWELTRNSVLGIRLFTGAIFTYNNSDIPFSRSYFAGGSNDIRAWQTYSLGPGRRTQGLEYNIGSFKLLGNIEYRFDMIGNVKGAFFIDGGNIWDITQTEITDSPSHLNNLKSLTDIAIGSGFGIRYDFKFLVARLDLGFKIREPYLKDERWFKHTNFSNVQYNIGINYPF